MILLKHPKIFVLKNLAFVPCGANRHLLNALSPWERSVILEKNGHRLKIE